MPRRYWALVGIAWTAVHAQAAPARPATFVTRDGAHLAGEILESSPSAPRPTFVVLHGGPGATHTYLRPEWDELARYGRVVYYDQRGCGASARQGPYSWQGHVRDLEDVLATVSPDHPVVLAGSSWGAELALAYAVSRPHRVRALILSGLVPWPGRGLPLPTARLDSFSRGVGSYPYAHNDSVPPDSDRLVLRTARADSIRRYVVLCRHVTALFVPGKISLPPLDSLRRIQAPVLLITGDSLAHMAPDGTGPVSRVLPAARRVVLKRTGHDPWLDDPGRFFGVVAEFLSTVLPARRAPA